jgi:hypothetical protein
MDKEIDLLLESVGEGYLAVEKATNLLWSREDLWKAKQAGQFQEADEITSSNGDTAVSGVYPGCLQATAASRKSVDRSVISETAHFLIFASRSNVP